MEVEAVAVKAESTRTFESQAAYDAAEYLSGDGAPDDPSCTRNLDFYRNVICSEPDGDLIDTIHSTWCDDNNHLETHHSYIQWLLPTRDARSSNPAAQPLQRHEARAIDSDPALLARARRSVQMMLRFWGLSLASAAAGETVRRDDACWREQFENLCRHPHNNLRITRALKFIGEIDSLRHLQEPIVSAFCTAIVDDQLLAPSAEALLLYWIPVVRDEAARKHLSQRAAVLILPPDTPLSTRLETLVALVRRMRRGANRASTSASASAGTGAGAAAPPAPQWGLLEMENAAAFAHLLCRDAGERWVPTAVGATLASELFAPSADGRSLELPCLLDITKWSAFVMSPEAPRLYKQELGRLPAFATTVHPDLSNYDPDKWPCFLRRYADYVAGEVNYKQTPVDPSAAGVSSGPRLADNPSECASTLSALVGATPRTAAWYIERALAAGFATLDEAVALYFDSGGAPPPEVETEMDVEVGVEVEIEGGGGE